MFVAAWTTGVAFTTSTIFYQAARFTQHPASSSAWIIGLLLVMTLTVIGLKNGARRSLNYRLYPGGRTHDLS